MIVCVCRSVSGRALDSAIAGGAGDLDAIARATGAGMDCGCCRDELVARVHAHAASAATAPCCATPCPGCPGRAAHDRAA